MVMTSPRRLALCHDHDHKRGEVQITHALAMNILFLRTCTVSSRLSMNVAAMDTI